MTDPSDSARALTPRYKGAVGRFDPVMGLTGWCADLQQPESPVELELRLDGRTIGRTTTRIPRADVCERLGLSGQFGFAFDPKLIAGLKIETRPPGANAWSVRVAHTEFELAQGASFASGAQTATAAPQPGEDATSAGRKRTSKREAHATTPEAAVALHGRRSSGRMEEPDNGEDAGAEGTQVAIDAAAAMPGFGIFMKGWIYSPAREVRALKLRLGDKRIEADPEWLTFSPRPDLLSMHPFGRDAVARAGFQCAFKAGAFDAAAAPSLEIDYEVGDATRHRLPGFGLHKIGLDEDGGRFREFYPHLEREAGFDDYARAYYAEALRHYGACRLQVATPAPLQWVFVAPSQRHRLYLAFEQIRENLPRLRVEGAGVLILAEDQSRHGELAEHVHALRGDFEGPCHVGYVADGWRAVWALEAALAALEARRFVFVGADALLTAEGWAAAHGLLSDDAPLTFLELADPCEPWAEPERSMRAFAGDAAAFASWRRARLLPLAAAPSAASWGETAGSKPGCAVLTANPPPSATLAEIDRRVGALPRGAL